MSAAVVCRRRLPRCLAGEAALPAAGDGGLPGERSPPPPRSSQTRSTDPRLPHGRGSPGHVRWTATRQKKCLTLPTLCSLGVTVLEGSRRGAARGAASPGRPPPLPPLPGGGEEVGSCPFPRGWVFFLGGEWEGHGIPCVPPTWRVGVSEEEADFCKQWVNAREWGGGGQSRPQGSLGTELPPDPLPPKPPTIAEAPRRGQNGRD